MVCFISGVCLLTFVDEKTPYPWMEGRFFVSCFVGQRWLRATFVPKRYLRFPLRKGNDVELVGFEPTSKQGNHTLSTRLFRPAVFRALARPGPPTNALSPKISFDERGHAKLFPIYLHRLISWLRNNSL